MSGYPYSHGQWPPPPQPPPQAPQHPQFAQYGYQPPSHPSQLYGNNPYQIPPQIPPQIHPPPPSQIPPAPNYFGASQASHAAFEHNANRVPGLGITVDAPGHRSPNAVGGDLSWSEAFPTTAASPSVYPPYKPPSPQQQHYYDAANHAPAGYHQPYPPQEYPKQHVPVPQQEQQQATYSPPPYPPISSTPQIIRHPYVEADSTTHPTGSELEEGELSEDMEDAYNPEETFGPTGLGDPRASSSPSSRDGPDESFKQPTPILPGTALGQAAANLPSRDVSVIDTQEDAFYDEDDDEEPGEIKSSGNGVSASDAADADDEDMGYSDSSEHKTPPPPAGQGRAASYSPRLSPGEVESDQAPIPTGLNGNGATNGAAENVIQQPSVAVAGPPPANKLPFATMDEAKKEAQRAILRLIPYGVNYQTYIDEGFDDKLIKALFSELGLKAAPAETADSPRSVSPAQAVSDTALPDSAGDGEAPKKEERKDRIARLLALKASKPAPVAAAPVALPAKPEKAQSEKGRLLQQKLEALRRTQELRTAAAAKAVAEATALVETLVRHSSDEATAIVEQIADKSAAISAAQSLESQQALPQPTTALLPTIAAGGGRKRPVAADFVDFATTTPNPLKRPFSLARQDSTLVIDVSDDSDDSDDDVEMEVDSPADETHSNVAQGSKRQHPRAGASSHRDQISPRHFGRTASAMPTPPTAPASMIARAKDDEYARKMREIEEMKRKIAEAEAKKARSTPTGSQTPQSGGNDTPPEGSGDASSTFAVRPPPRMRRIMSTGEMSKDEEDGSTPAKPESSPAAQFFADAVSARLPKPSDKFQRSSPSSSSREGHREKRVRVASLQLPRVEANLQEKMFKLRLLQDKVAALQAEIDAGIAEKRRLTEDIEDLATEPDEAAEPSEGTPAQPQNDVLLDADETNETRTSQPLANIVQQEEEEVAVPNSVTHLAPGGEDALQTDIEPSNAKLSEANSDAEASAEAEVGAEASPADGETESESVVMSDASSPYEPSSDAVDEDGDILMEDGDVDVDVDVVVDEDADADKEEEVVEPRELQEPPAAVQQASTTAPAGKAAAATKVAATSSNGLSPTFVPYESPLQYFRSYRYHPQYKDRVAGGLKSLTYSGKIQDDIELCPFEVDGQTCPDPACAFQHYASIVPQDDQILVELGRSDDYTGDQKARFVDGLKNVLKQVRDAKVRDFDTIADAIVDFRRAFLADDSRVLSHLEGVTV